MDTEQGERTEAGEVGPDDHLSGIHGHRPWLPALIGAAVLIACMLSLLVLGDLRQSPRAAIGWLLLAGVAHGVTCFGLWAMWPLAQESRRRLLLLAIMTLSVALRLIALGLPPTLSDDVYRYRWDGRVQAHGINPYSLPPAAPELQSLRDAEWEQINYPRIRTIYPPLAQMLFAATYRLTDTVAGFRLVAVLGDLLVLILLAACLRVFHQPGWMLALYALHPLPAVEFGSSGHFDAWVLACVLLAIWAHGANRPTLSTAALGAGVLMKTWPVVLVPLLLRHRPRWHLALLGAVIVAGFLPYAGAGVAMLHPWLEYAGRWRFNDGLFRVLATLTGSLEAAKAAAAAIGLGLLAWLWKRDTAPLAGSYWLLLAFIVLMPTVHPWYLLWALPLAALAGDVAWVLLCSLAPAAYWILVGAGGDSGTWTEPWWPRLVEYVPAFTLWVVLAWRYGPPAIGRTPPFVRTSPERGAKERGKT